MDQQNKSEKPTRRQFLKTGVTALGAAGIAVPSLAVGEPSTAVAPLRTIDSTGFCQGWWFRLGEYDVGHMNGHMLGRFAKPPGWELVNLPHTYNAANTFVDVRGYYRGIGWYRKHITLSSGQVRRKVYMEFGAAFSVADLWVNAQHVGQYMGGYTGFCADVTDFVHSGENLVAVKVTNVHDPNVLPGKDIPDYDLYGGLYREAALVIKNGLHIPQYGIRVTTPRVSEAAAAVHVAVKVRNDGVRRHCEAWVGLRDPEGKVIGEKRLTAVVEPGTEKTLEVAFEPLAHPELWSVETPHLYSVQVRIGTGSRPTDEDAAQFGIRRYEFKVNEGFFLNGKRVELRGMDRHQDYPGLGNALPHRLQVRDVEMFRDAGANFVRLSHYPQHPVFLDACDRLGVLVYEEIATWQYIGGPVFVHNAEAMMHQMIARDANHPSIILWGMMNEGRSRPMFEHLNRIAHDCDPTRLTVYADNNPLEGQKLGTVEVPDVLGINYHTREIDHLHALLPECKLVTSEHSNATAERGDLAREMQQIDKVKANLDILESPRRRYMAGSTLWCMHDYGTDYWGSWPEQHSGAVDSARLPKELWHYLKSRWTREPMVHLCGHWTWPGQEGKLRTVTVVSNCETVELFIGGRSLGVKKGANPLRWKVAYERSPLKAVGHSGERKVSDELRPAGPAAKLNVKTDRKVIKADGAEVAELTVSVEDAKGVLVPGSGEVHFEVSGPGALRGIGGWPKARIALGVGRVVVQSTPKPGEIRVRAKFRKLPLAEVSVQST